MDPSLAVIKVIPQRGDGDCAIACLAMYLDRPYEDVLAAAASHFRSRRIHRTGMYISQIKATALALGVRLRCQRARIDFDTDIGILGFDHPTGGHVVILRRGEVIDPAGGTTWDDPELYLLHQEAKPKTLVLVTVAPERTRRGRTR